MKIILTSELKASLTSVRSNIALELDKLSPVLKSWNAKKSDCAKLESEIQLLEEANDLSMEQTMTLCNKRDHVESLERQITRLEKEVSPKSDTLRQALRAESNAIYQAFKPTYDAYFSEVKARIAPASKPFFVRDDVQASFFTQNSDAINQFGIFINRRFGER